MKNLLLRSLTGSIYVGIVLTALLVHPLALILLSSLFCFLAMRELLAMQQIRSAVPVWVGLHTVLTGGTALLMYYQPQSDRSLILLFAGYIILFVSALFNRNETEGVHSFQVNTSALFYITLPLLLINRIHSQAAADQIPYTLLLFVGIWSNDSFAYLFGRSLGRHKLFERISPKKTWEGFMGGLLATLALAWGYSAWSGTRSLAFWLGFGLLVTVSATLGDLLESLLKRSAGVKDSGNLLPGHGGLLDRIDSLLFVSPVVFLYLSLN